MTTRAEAIVATAALRLTSTDAPQECDNAPVSLHTHLVQRLANAQIRLEELNNTKNQASRAITQAMDKHRHAVQLESEMEQHIMQINEQIRTLHVAPSVKNVTFNKSTTGPIPLNEVTALVRTKHGIDSKGEDLFIEYDVRIPSGAARKWRDMCTGDYEYSYKRKGEGKPPLTIVYRLVKEADGTGFYQLLSRNEEAAPAYYRPLSLKIS